MNPRKINPDVARLRGALAVSTRHHPDADHTALRAELAACTWQSRLERLIEQAPPLSPERAGLIVVRVATVLGGAHAAA